MYKLLVWQTVADSYRFTFGNIGLLIKISLVWLIVSYAIGFVIGVAIGLTGSPGVWLNLFLVKVVPWLVGLIAISAVAVAWHRACLLEDRTTGLFAAPLSKRVWKFFVVSIVFTGLGYLLFFLVSMLIFKLGGSATFTLGAVLAAFLLIVLVFVRLNLLFPAIAIESVSVTMERSWHLTKGNAWRLILGNLACFLPVSIAARFFVDWSGELTEAGRWLLASAIAFVGQALAFLTVALLAAFLSFAYKKLVPEMREES